MNDKTKYVCTVEKRVHKRNCSQFSSILVKDSKKGEWWREDDDGDDFDHDEEDKDGKPDFKSAQRSKRNEKLVYVKNFGYRRSWL